jgi:hypothetical protein
MNYAFGLKNVTYAPVGLITDGLYPCGTDKRMVRTMRPWTHPARRAVLFVQLPLDIFYWNSFLMFHHYQAEGCVESMLLTID